MPLANHLNYVYEDGKVYCKRTNKVIGVTELNCDECDMFSGSLQGEGVECYWDDERVTDDHAGLWHVLEPYQEYDFLNPDPRLVFSRKGFDSKAGGTYSPYNPITRKYIVLPIPGSNFGNGKKFKDVKIKENHIGIRAKNLKELILSEEMNVKDKTKNLIKDKPHVHFDPMLGSCPWIDDNITFQGSAFGQADAAQSHLNGEGVKEGSIFLFFSRFKPIPVDNIEPLDPRLSWKDGAYFIYGWMKIGKIITEQNQIDDEILTAYHPHTPEKAFKMMKNNTIYLPTEKLFDDSNIPGCGYFQKLTDNLLLSSMDHKTTPSIWKLPSFLKDTSTSYIKEWYKQNNDDSYCYAKIPDRGQEFVCDLKDSKNKLMDWLRSLFTKDNYVPSP